MRIGGCASAYIDGKAGSQGLSQASFGGVNVLGLRSRLMPLALDAI